MRVIVVTVLTLLVAGCGDEPSPTCVIDPTLVADDEFETSPAQLPKDLCTPGALKGFDPTGLWYVVQPDQPNFGGPGPVRFDLQCPELLTADGTTRISPRNFEDVALTEDLLYWRNVREFEENFRVAESFMICDRAAEEEETYAGLFRRCVFFDGSTFCTDTAVTMKRHARADGEGVAEGIELVSEFHGSENDPWPTTFSANVRVKDDIAYFAHSDDGLRVLDVSDITSPRELAHFPAESDFINDIKLTEGPTGTPYALLASDARGVLVIDISDPANPQQVTIFTLSNQPQHGVHTIFVEPYDDKIYAYLADSYTNQLAIWDITDPAVPELRGSYFSEFEEWIFHDLFVEGDRVYGSGTDGGLIVFDTQPDPAAPTKVGQYITGDWSHSNWVTTTSSGRKVSVHGGEGYDAHLRIIDVDEASPTFMEELGEFQTRSTVSIHNIMAFGDKAYVAHYEDGLRIFDISDPTAPIQTGYFNSWDADASPAGRFEGLAGIDVDLERKLIFATDSTRGLLILRDNTP